MVYVAKQLTTSGGTIGGYNRDAIVSPAPIPAAPAPTPPINRTITDGTQYNPGTTGADTSADAFLDTFRAPESADQIAERKRQQSQGLIDSLNKNFDDQVAERKQVGQERLNMDNAISVLTGNSGGSEAVGSRTKVLDANSKDLEAVNNQRALALSQVYTQISRDADQEARDQLTDATKSAEEIVARREQSQQKAVDSLKLMAGSGAIDFDAFKTSPQNAKVYNYALQAFGGSEDALRGFFALNRPQDQILDKRVVGSTMYLTYQNPQTGAVRSDHFDLGFQVPTDWKNVDLGDRVMFYDPNNPDNRKYYSKGQTPDQAAKNSAGYTVDENGNVIQTGNYDSLTIGRYNRAVNAATSILQKNPTFKNIVGASAYLDRIEAASNNPGSVGDQELLDAFTQLNTGGNRVTEAQVELITGNQSLADSVSKFKNKLQNGGALSNSQRQQILSLAHEVYGNYQRSYQPLYDDATQRLKAQGIPEQFWNIPNPKTLSRSVSDGSTAADQQLITAPDGTQVQLTD